MLRNLARFFVEKEELRMTQFPTEMLKLMLQIRMEKRYGLQGGRLALHVKKDFCLKKGMGL